MATNIFTYAFCDPVPNGFDLLPEKDVGTPREVRRFLWLRLLFLDTRRTILSEVLRPPICTIYKPLMLFGLSVVWSTATFAVHLRFNIFFLIESPFSLPTRIKFNHSARTYPPIHVSYIS